MNGLSAAAVDTFDGVGGVRVTYHSWVPAAPRVTLQIAHGMGEHAARYRDFAEYLAARGVAVYANDHRGHGRTAHTPGVFGEDGWNNILADMRQLNDVVAGRHPVAPRILLGHSMGALAAQHYATRYGDSIDALILSGSPGVGFPRRVWMLRAITRFERWRVGAWNESGLLASLLFGDANKLFEAHDASGFEWLSRDAEAVERYVSDPLCGFVPCTQSLLDMLDGAAEATSPEAIARTPERLPIYLFSGEDDPVHERGEGLDRLIDRLRVAGLGPERKLYPGARHETLNETNRLEVYADVLLWIEASAQTCRAAAHAER